MYIDIGTIYNLKKKNINISDSENRKINISDSEY